MWAADSVPPVTLSSDTTLSSEGYFVLSWNSSADSAGFTLHETSVTNPDFIRANDLPASGALTITGLTDGIYSYRLYDNDLPLSNSVTIEVQHHGLGRALGFFSLGLVLFSLLVASIAIGHKRSRKNDAG